MKYLLAAASVILVYAFSVTAMAQENGSQDQSSTDQIEGNINTQIWANFTRSYKELDAEFHMNLYNPNIVRVTHQKGSVLSEEEYIKMTGECWKCVTQNPQSVQTYSFVLISNTIMITALMKPGNIG